MNNALSDRLALAGYLRGDQGDEQPSHVPEFGGELADLPAPFTRRLVDVAADEFDDAIEKAVERGENVLNAIDARMTELERRQDGVFEVFHEESAIRIPFVGEKPTKAHADDAAFDLRASSAVTLRGGQATKVLCNLQVAIPEGYAGLICSRSGLALNASVNVLNSPGVIDPGFRGEVGVILHMHAPGFYVVQPGDRIAQLVIIPTALTQFEKADTLPLPTEYGRGSNGFGSTGR